MSNIKRYTKLKYSLVTLEAMEKIRLLILFICYAGIVSSTSPRTALEYFNDKLLKRTARCVKRNIDKESALQSFSIGNDDFTNSFLYEVYNTKGGSNVMSPFSILFILAQLALFTITESHTQLMNVMNFGFKEQIRVLFPVLTKDFGDQRQVDFSLASKTYVGSSLTSNFLYATETYFNSEAQDLDFSKPEDAADTINKWVADNTRNLIPKLVSADMFSPLTQLVLVNALYLKANWTKPFKPQNTEDKNFYLNNIQRPIKVKMMYQQNTFRIGDSEDLGAKIIQLPYKGGNFSLYVLLPNIVEGLTPMLEKMKDRSVLANAFDCLESKPVELSLPKFKTESSFDLTEYLPKVNITYIFDPKKSGITGILKEEKPTYVSSGIQKAVIEVNEYGSLAAAATAISVNVASAFTPPSEVIFNADHPFAYILTYQNITLFCGTFAN